MNIYVANFYLGSQEDFTHDVMSTQKTDNMGTFRSCLENPVSCWLCPLSASGAHTKLHSCRLKELALLALVQEGLTGFISVDTSSKAWLPRKRKCMYLVWDGLNVGSDCPARGTSWNRPGMFCSALKTCENRQIRLHSKAKGSHVWVRKSKPIAHVLYIWKYSPREEMALGPWELMSQYVLHICKTVGNQTFSWKAEPDVTNGCSKALDSQCKEMPVVWTSSHLFLEDFPCKGNSGLGWET